jgi:polar amino acid transport system substrate-binding protein
MVLQQITITFTEERLLIMKKITALLLALAMVLSLAACGGSTPSTENNNTASDAAASGSASDTSEASETSTADSDLAYVKEKGTLVVGITDFAPMDYQDENNEWIGFDADMARAFAESLGVSVEFVEITWDNKVLELDGKTIDCVWNGMTLNEEVLSAMECSDPYCGNAQIVVVPVDKADDYQTVESIADLSFAVESGSAGKEQLEALGYSYTEVSSQADALMEVAAGTSDAAVIDLLMAAAMVGEGTGYDNLTYTVSLNSEEYGVGFRKGSDLAAALNDFFAASLADGSMEACAETYGVQDAILATETVVD